MNFKPINPNPDFSKAEEELLKQWQKNDIVHQYIHKNDNSNKKFSFIDGPITANAPMGVHHARGRTLKDVFQRYKNATGHQQRFQNGFDCQGLWVEVEVEKEAGFNSKKDIIQFGVDNFTKACVARVNKYADIQTKQSERLGMFMDWDNSYYTMSETNNLYIWHFLKKVHQNGWLEKRKSAATWCPRCETGLSQHEQADGYQDIIDTSVYLKFKLKDKKNEYVLAWTTTPWTLAANVLLAININHQYVSVSHQGEILYLAKSSADRLGLTNQTTIDPKTLLNQEYESLFKIPAQKNIHHYLTQWEMVDPIEGSGVVHIAPGCGQEDFQLGLSLKTEMPAPLDETGHFIDGYGQLTGKYAHNVSDIVIEYLKSINSLFKTESITHRYPHCWRCKTKCLFRLEDSWYIKSDKIRPLLKKTAESVNWHPKYVGRRMQNWLDTMEDWMISRKRFYGLALPIYPCDCGEITVIGSKEELKSKATKPTLVDNLKSLHRPWIDEIEINCPKCDQSVKRVTDVGDCWLDAGVVPFSTLKYLENKQYWQKWFPADLVLEMIEQVRLWFYSMLFFSVTFENTTPYLNLLAHSEVRDEKGQKMSKTKKNGIPFDEAVSKMGADSMRWLYCQQKSHHTVNFGFNIADQVKRDFLLILWNSYKFFNQRIIDQNWQLDQNFDPEKLTHVMDQWIISRLHHTIATVTKNLDKFSTPPSILSLESFVTDLSTWYIRRSRDRNDNLSVLHYIFNNLSQILAPFIPFLSDTIYQNLHPNKTTSVHLQDWPVSYPKLIKLSLEKQMQQTRELCRQIHAQRQTTAIKLRQPLAQATISGCQPLKPEFQQIILDETNIKKIIFQNTSDSNLHVNLDTKLTPKLIEEGEYRDFVRNIQVLRKEMGMKVNDKIIIYAPTWPKSFESEILFKTLATKIIPEKQLRLEKI